MPQLPECPITVIVRRTLRSFSCDWSSPLEARTGHREAIATAYLAVNQAFEQVGNLNQLPPAVAAWSPNSIFLMAGLYAMTRMTS
jgi:hypothetical protein